MIYSEALIRNSTASQMYFVIPFKQHVIYDQFNKKFTLRRKKLLVCVDAGVGGVDTGHSNDLPP